MKSRHLAMATPNQRRQRRILWLVALLLLGVATAAFAQEGVDPPGRVAHLGYRQGGVVFAPQGEDEWIELPQNRPVTVGDRLWSDRGARAELQLGAATLHLDGESHLGVSQLDEHAAQFILQQGGVNLRVRELVQGENVEIGTPNVAFRALQPGDYRIDVDPRNGQTRVLVRSGLAAVFGEGGESIHLGGNQQASFAGRFLAQVEGPQFVQDDFGLWAAERNRQEDQSIAARHVPRGVVGSTQLDAYGAWDQDANHGAVWYPRVTVQDWAPYRYGQWAWIAPWGWTWIDDAPWGFAPFHYGRWTVIGSRWAWVPGRLAPRPVYAPALVVFLGGGGVRLTIGAGPAVGWYPLAPGEAWWPVYRTTPRYVTYANHSIDLNAYPRHYDRHYWRQRPLAVTAVPEEDFRRGRPVVRHWQSLAAPVIGQSRIHVVPVRPDVRQRADFRQAAPLLQVAPAAVQPAVPRFWGTREVPAAVEQPAVPRVWGTRDVPSAVREQYRAQREQDRLQREAERAAREQQRAAELARQQQDLRWQREQQLRQQREQAAAIGVQRQQHEQEQAARQRAQQEQAARVEQVRAQREQPREASRSVRPVEPPRTMAPQQAAPIGRQERRAQRDEGGHPGRGLGRGPRWARD